MPPWALHRTLDTAVGRNTAVGPSEYSLDLTQKRLLKRLRDGPPTHTAHPASGRPLLYKIFAAIPHQGSSSGPTYLDLSRAARHLGNTSPVERMISYRATFQKYELIQTEPLFFELKAGL